LKYTPIKTQSWRPAGSTLRAMLSVSFVLLAVGCATKIEPITEAEFTERAARDKRIIAQTVPLDQALLFGTAAAHALANNLDIRLAAFDAVLARGQVDLTDLQKLPTLVRNAGYTFRDPPGTNADKVVLRQFPGMALAASLAGPGFTPLSKGADSAVRPSGGILTSRTGFIACRRHCMSPAHGYCIADGKHWTTLRARIRSRLASDTGSARKSPRSFAALTSRPPLTKG
jgi:hypothetical protein